MSLIETRTFINPKPVKLTWQSADATQKIDLVKANWETGTTAARIAAGIAVSTGFPVTRNAIIGFYRRHRASMPNHPLSTVTDAHIMSAMRRRTAKFGADMPKPKQPRRKPTFRDHASRAKSVKPPMPIVYIDPDAPPSKQLRLADLSKFECKWETTNSHSAADFRFCGHHAPVGPWCSFHASKAKGAA